MCRQLLAAIFVFVLHTAAHSAEPVDVAVSAVSCVDGAYGTRFPGSLSRLRQLGHLREERQVRVEEWDSYKAIEKRLQFDGMSVNIITFTNDPERYSLASVSVESSSWLISPWRVGDSPEPLFKLLGVKAPARNGAWRFHGESDSLYVEVRKGKVLRIGYECYTG